MVRDGSSWITQVFGIGDSLWFVSTDAWHISCSFCPHKFAITKKFILILIPKVWNHFFWGGNNRANLKLTAVWCLERDATALQPDPTWRWWHLGTFFGTCRILVKGMQIWGLLSIKYTRNSLIWKTFDFASWLF